MKTGIIKFGTTLGAMALLSLTSALAGEGHQHAAKRGGVVVESGHHHLEVVAKDGTIEIYVSGEDGAPETVADAKATVAILSGGKKVDVGLTPDPSGALKGAGDFKVAKGTTIVVTLTMPGHSPEQARVKLD